jgi:hypothetical protein
VTRHQDDAGPGVHGGRLFDGIYGLATRWG